MSTSTVSKVRFTQALRSRAFALLWIGQSISALGDGAFTTALAWQVVVITHSATTMGVILIAQLLPRLVFLLIGGVAADRLPRRQVLFWSDAGRAIVVFAIAALSWTNQLQTWHLIGFALIFGVVGAFFGPAFRAIPPQLVPVEALPSANSLTELTGQMGTMLGPLIGAVLISVVSPASAFGFDALTFVISALSLFAIRLPLQHISSSAEQAEIAQELDQKTRLRSPAHGFLSMLSDIREGIGYVSSSTWLKATIIIPAISNAIFSGAMIIAFPRLVHDIYSTGAWLIGVVGTAEGLGFVAATFFTGQVRLRKRGIIAFLGSILSSLALIAFGLPLSHTYAPLVAILAAACAGFGIGILQTIWVTLLHELVPNDKLGRVSSIDMVGSICLMPVGYALAGILTDHIGPQPLFVIGGSVCLILYAAALFLRDIRKLE